MGKYAGRRVATLYLAVPSGGDTARSGVCGGRMMVTQELIKKNKVKFPAPGCVFVKLLTKNVTTRCFVLRVGKVNSAVEIKGVEAKVPNEDIDIDDDWLYPEEAEFVEVVKG
jgi:hypothetical protein